MNSGKKFAIFGALALAASSAAQALPYTLTTTLTADNHYALYFGGASGDGMRQATMNGEHARNELDWFGAPGKFNWSMAESWTLDYARGDWLYVVTWSDDVVAQGWIGEFASADEQFLTGLGQGWEYILGNTNLGDGDPAPLAGELASMVAAGGWADVANFRDHGVNPWGMIAGVSTDADWIWGTPTMNEYGTGVGEYQVFRRRLGTVPEPGTLSLAVTAFAGFALARHRARRRQPALAAA